jgi:phage-related protein
MQNPLSLKKPLEWIGNSRDELLEFPRPVIKDVGYALDEAQRGGKSDAAKPLTGFGGAGVLEVVASHDGNTYRAVYTVKFLGIVYVLHCFQKKSKSGIATPPQTIDLVKKRLKIAELLYKERVTIS